MSKNRFGGAWFALVLFLGLAPAATAEQLTTVAIFDMDQVLLSFYSDSDVVRDYRRAAEQYQADILIAENDLQDLQARRATALSRNDANLASRLRVQITDQQEFIYALNERWYQTEDDLLAELNDDPFFRTVHEVAGYVAEENGYTIIIDRSQTDLRIFWYSPSVDVTEDIIQELLVRFR